MCVCVRGRERGRDNIVCRVCDIEIGCVGEIDCVCERDYMCDKYTTLV